jgi:hypothetical protein
MQLNEAGALVIAITMIGIDIPYPPRLNDTITPRAQTALAARLTPCYTR